MNETTQFKIADISETLLNLMPDLVLVKGAASHILWANKAFQEYYGMANEQLQGIIDSPITQPDHTQQYIKDDEYVFTTGKTLHISAEPVTRHDGRIQYFNTIKSAVRDAEGKIVMTIGISRDVTERKIAEEQLRLHSKAIESSTEGIIITDAQHTDGGIVFANRGFSFLTGYSNKEIMGKNCRFLQGEKTDKKTVTKIKKCIEKHINFEGEILNYKKDGTTFWNFLRITPVFDEKGVVTQFIGFQTDISERKNAEEETKNVLRNLEKLNSFMVDRELKMTELKREIVELKKQQPSTTIS